MSCVRSMREAHGQMIVDSVPVGLRIRLYDKAEIGEKQVKYLVNIGGQC